MTSYNATNEWIERHYFAYQNGWGRGHQILLE